MDIMFKKAKSFNQDISS
ncbi:hypothetical protein JIY74_30080 [Vibrio harveyi]|nr:hypothetical protein [Vibrio harveyi]